MSDLDFRTYKAEREVHAALEDYLKIKQNLLNLIRNIAEKHEVNYSYLVNFSMEHSRFSEEVEQPGKEINDNEEGDGD